MSRNTWIALGAASAALALLAAAWMLLAVIAPHRPAAPPAAPAVAAPPAGAPGGATDCDVERSAPVAFTRMQAQDTLHVTIQGAPCAKARVVITVQGPDGAELYRYEAPFPPHLGAEEARRPLPEAAASFADAVLANAGIAGSTDQLPPWRDAAAYYSTHKDALKLDEAGYEALRRVKRPILWHATGAETWRSVVYDPETRRGRVILAGGS
jgi:hypothetical protein